jgi:DNA polymerase-3 subunit beta
METTESVHAAAKVEKDGALCVPSRVLTELVSSLPSETVALAIKDGSLSVRCSGFAASIPGVPGAEFPPVPQLGKTKGTSLQKQALIRALNQVLFAAAADEGRPLLTGIRITHKDDTVVFAATDGYRLSVKKLALPIKNNVQLIGAGAGAFEVVKVVWKKKAEEIAFCRKKGASWRLSLATRKFYPADRRRVPEFRKNYSCITPRGCSLKSTEPGREVCRDFARDNANIIRFHIENQTMVVLANTPQVGENQVEVGAKVGDGGDIAFNSRFLLEFLANFSEDELLFEMTGSSSPVFRPAGDDSFLHVIMPVRVQGERSAS